MAIVADASALVYAATETGRAAARLRRRLVDDTCHAPHLVDAEVGNVLRRKVLRHELDAGDAAVLLAHVATLVDHRHEHHGPLARAAWALRGSLTFYDALYVALAAALGVPLVTADRRLARTRRLPCRVSVVGGAATAR